MKWIEPENGGVGSPLNLEKQSEFSKYISGNDPLIVFTSSSWIYPDESSRDADYERIRRIALGICDHAGNKPAENSDPYAVDWSQIPEVYNYVATDADGLCFAYDKLPSIYNDSGWNLRCGEYKPLKRIENNPDWKNSLRIRPRTEKSNA